ncbi:precorrin-4 C(11)-methyltransferase [Butyrivibrio sp. INlla14]|uniref:precorrin-4 C(11)-methyltransferase n=1 Tax=Butyrivibrio sp. INlla14 TaxID=1520808 RepID=UPI0008766701|nr:precorrin-4 C(11)-methyltransferase [Butyrivibrio sp. INlla14]SCY02601.1 precorrin-4/cobalt-precorrin-4 C11-methyltransferase [Butyrivibrio sp. INlla14]
MVHFVGAGPGATDLITIRGQRLLQEADVIIYAGSLVNPELLEFAQNKCEIYNSALLSLEEVIDIMKKADQKKQDVVRLHTGDPSIYGAIREQMDELDKLGIVYDDTPGVSSFCGAAAALNLEYTLPGVSQSVIITRMEGRTKVPEKESVEALSSHEATMVFFLSAGDVEGLCTRLIASGRQPDTPCALVYKASWQDEKKFVSTLEKLPEIAKEQGINKTALIIVGDVVSTGNYEKSKLYDKDFETLFRGKK